MQYAITLGMSCSFVHTGFNSAPVPLHPIPGCIQGSKASCRMRTEHRSSFSSSSSSESSESSPSGNTRVGGRVNITCSYSSSEENSPSPILEDLPVQRRYFPRLAMEELLKAGTSRPSQPLMQWKQAAHTHCNITGQTCLIIVQPCFLRAASCQVTQVQRWEFVQHQEAFGYDEQRQNGEEKCIHAWLWDPLGH